MNPFLSAFFATLYLLIATVCEAVPASVDSPPLEPSVLDSTIQDATFKVVITKDA